MNDPLQLIGRGRLFGDDLRQHGPAIDAAARDGRFLVVGGAGSIGAAVVRELFRRRPRVLHVVDISENNLAELVRDLRSSIGHIPGEFHTYCVDCTSPTFAALVAAGGGYDFVLNFSALKHVRSERDPFTLMRLLEVNVRGAAAVTEAAAACGAKRCFGVSTDKASGPASMMGASKRAMEMVLMAAGDRVQVSSARFANVLFSDGSLPFGWLRRLEKRQPIVAPHDVRRYFVSAEEGAILCMLSAFAACNGEVVFPRFLDESHARTFSDLAVRFLESRGYQPMLCDSEDEARAKCAEAGAGGRWPCYFFQTDTTGEKDVETFFDPGELVDLDRFTDAGVVLPGATTTDAAPRVRALLARLQQLQSRGQWTKQELVALVHEAIGGFDHLERNKHLDDRM